MSSTKTARIARTWAWLLCLLPLPLAAAEARVAVATNFAATAEQLVDGFEQGGEHRVTIVSGSTGKLYAQIVHGAPFDLLLAADQHRPRRLEREGHAVSGSRRTYAFGRLVLWSPDPARIAPDGTVTLRGGAFRRLALANPELAPYGAAARESLLALDLFDALEQRFVMGENVGQTHAMIATGNAELGFVALSHVLDAAGSRWDVPEALHTPIRQDAVLLRRAEHNEAARAFLEYLASDEARSTIERAGYGSR